MTSSDISSLLGIVDVEKYPIQDPESEKYQQLVTNTQKIYEQDGIAILPGFLTTEAITRSVAEVVRARGESRIKAT